MKIAHIADTHIKQTKDHKEYMEIFCDLFDKLKQEAPDIILHCGDIAHNKTNLSPEFIDICAFFLKGLQSIAPTFIILGNHDGNLNNLQRQDAISPIVSLLPVDKRPTIFRFSDEVEIENVKLHIISRFDKQHVPNVDENKINIVLYHGSISGCKTDSGFIMKNGEAELSFFEKYDFGMFGDIHKHQFLDKAGRFAYPGSTCIQNFGESGEKGFLLWDIKTKDDFSCKFVPVSNPNPYISINAKNIKDIPEKCRLRLLIDEEDQANKSEILSRLPSGVLVECKNLSSQTSKSISAVNEKKINFDLLQYISKFEKNEDRQVEIKDEIKRIRSELKIEESKFLSRWSIKSLSWDNFFNYGEKNSINFDLFYGGILGIFGKNFSGKSSVVDCLIFSIFGECTKNIKKLSQIVNTKKQSAHCEIKIEGDGKEYVISRTIDSGKGTVSVFCNGACLNGSDKNETEKLIRKLFGSAEHFLLSSIVSQFDCFQFLNATSSKRKEYLLSFLDLEEIEKIGDYISPVLRDLKAEKKIWDGKGLHDQKERLSSVEADSLWIREDDHRAGISVYRANVAQLEALQKQLSARFLLKDHACHSKQDFLEKAEKHRKNSEEIPIEIQELTALCAKKEKYIQKVDALDSESIIKDKNEAVSHFELIERLNKENESLNRDISFLTGSVSVLSSVPCESSMKQVCPLTKNAYDNKNKIDQKQKAIEQNCNNLKNLEESSEKYQELIWTYDMHCKVLDKRKIAKTELDDAKRQIEILRRDLKKSSEFLALVDECGEEAFYSVPNQFKLVSLKSDILAYDKEEVALELEKKNLKDKLAEIYSEIEKMQECETKFQKFSVLGEMFHRDGLISIIIEDFIPYINKKMDEILENLVDFRIRLENAKDKLEIYLKSTNGERNIELCSGSEKTFAAMALRIALTKLGNIPSSNVFILDEPATSLDAEHILQFQKFLNMAKEEFDSVILITHLEQMKDAIDKMISVQVNESGFAYLEG